MKKKWISYTLFLVVALVSCNDMRDMEPKRDYPADATVRKMLILSEGLFNLNNSTLAEYDFNEPDKTKQLETDLFRLRNKRGLGDTANDMQRYGSKVYIVVNVSSQIEVIDAETAVSIKRIPMFNEKNIGRQPRYIDFYEGKAYICSFDGTVARLDTATLEMEKFVKVGRNPDGICIANKKIYVTNSGGLSYPNYDHTVSVVDIATFKEVKKIDIGMNPFKIHADSEGDVYVVTRGNYGDVGYAFHKIDSEIDQKVYTFPGLSVYNFEIYKDKAYMYNYDFFSGESWIKVFDCLTEKVIDEHFIKDKSITINTPYALSINPINDDVYVVDAQFFVNWGDLLCFDKKGNFKFRINEVGLNPNHILFFEN